MSFSAHFFAAAENTENIFSCLPSAQIHPTLMRRSFFLSLIHFRRHIWFPSTATKRRRKHFYIPFITGLILKLNIFPIPAHPAVCEKGEKIWQR